METLVKTYRGEEIENLLEFASARMKTVDREIDDLAKRIDATDVSVVKEINADFWGFANLVSAVKDRQYDNLKTTKILKIERVDYQDDRIYKNSTVMKVYFEPVRTRGSSSQSVIYAMFAKDHLEASDEDFEKFVKDEIQRVSGELLLSRNKINSSYCNPGVVMIGIDEFTISDLEAMIRCINLRKSMTNEEIDEYNRSLEEALHGEVEGED